MLAWYLALGFGGGVPACLAGAERLDTPVRVRIDEPATGGTVRGRFDMLRISGLAEAGERQAVFDVMLVVDVSFSTTYPSGIDVDGDGKMGMSEPSLIPGLRGTENTDPDDSILAAEILAADRLLDALDPERVRVGVVSFSGFVSPTTGKPVSDQPSAQLEQPLTSDFEAVRRTLQAVKLRGALGGTDMQAGIKAAVVELAALEGAVSEPRPGSRRVILMLTDGAPSLPFGSVQTIDPEDLEATFSAGKLAAEAGVVINVFGLGRGATDYPEAATAISQITGGSYVPVRRPGDVVTVLTGVTFADVDGVQLQNLTTGEFSSREDVAVLPDGSFRGFVAVRPGVNRIRVSAYATDGTRGATEVEVNYLLQDLSDTELRAELERVRKRNRDIQIATERRRQEAIRQQQRERAVTLEVEDGQVDEEANP